MLIVPIYSFAGFAEIKNRIRNRFKDPVTLPPENQRTVTVLPETGLQTTVETALNSRCTSDYDEAQELSHWGMLNKDEKLSTSQVSRIVAYSNIPKLTNETAEVQVSDNVLIFSDDKSISGIQRDWMMIENGMRQQAVCLTCSALGVGMVFKALGKNGRKISDTRYAILKIRLDAMKPSYGGLYWSNRPPAGSRPWLTGNLPDPDRTGSSSLVETLASLTYRNKGEKEVTQSTLGQLLWAARGRTPHLYKSRAWGMTIPTSRGEQTNTDVNLLEKDKVSRYINWSGGRPAHSLKKNSSISDKTNNRLKKVLQHNTSSLILSGNSHSEKICMETGYQLLNILVQAKSLNLTYSTLLFDEQQKKLVSETGIKNPIAAVCF